MFTKDPDAELDYRRDWSKWLPEGDTIETSTWLVPDGITSESESHDDTTATIWLSGGTVGQSYEITNRITTTEGRTDDRTFTVAIRNL